MCSGSSTSATITSVNAPSNQLHHLYYDNAAYAGLDISTACHPPSLLEESMTSTQTSMAGRDLEAAPKLQGLIQSSTISILRASTPPMLPRWSLTDPSERSLLYTAKLANETSQNRQPSTRRPACSKADQIRGHGYKTTMILERRFFQVWSSYVCSEANNNTTRKA